LFFLLVVAASALALLWFTWDAILPYLIGIGLAYVLSPLVVLIERVLPGRGKLAGLRRMVAVVLVYIVVFGLLIAFAVTVGRWLAEETAELLQQLGTLWDQAIAQNGTIESWYTENVPSDLQESISGNIDHLGTSGAAWITTPITLLLEAVSSVLGIVITLFFIPLFMFYLLIERPTASASIARSIPAGWHSDLQAFKDIVHRVVFAYFRGVLLEGSVLGVATALALWAVGAPYPVALGVITGIAVFIPYIGFWLAFLATVIVVWALDPGLLGPVLLITGVLQVIDNWYLSPKFKGGAVGFTPAQTLFLVALCVAIFGGIGAFIAVPLAGMIRETCFYVYRRLTPAGAAAGPAAPAEQPIVAEVQGGEP
jgi:predicted PurR-regulated permease PerM